MLFEEYLRNLIKLSQESPETLRMKVAASSDDEGNSFNDVYFGPTILCLDENNEILNCEDADEDDTKVLCIN